jgi:hypothetical protein
MPRLRRSATCIVGAVLDIAIVGIHHLSREADSRIDKGVQDIDD